MVEIKTIPIIAKLVCLVILFIALVVGSHAHFNNAWTRSWGNPGYPEYCRYAFPNCPSSAVGMEKTFVAFTIIIFILSIVSIIAGFLVKGKKFRIVDTGYHAIAGLLLIISGILMIAAANQIDSANVPDRIPELIRDSLRKEFKYSNKLAGGSMAVIDGVIYLVAAGLIFKF
ncbi:uncharacterized protein LOC110854974 [Folsomia candida]|uniref:uncharacterized protein LOC110854974 n=1 Tax=Folsomia candida TaxID=158441 RepID=UPI000B8F1846|nr:uncharacterized protein LOC110854974 [Folsomia candida]